MKIEYFLKLIHFLYFAILAWKEHTSLEKNNSIFKIQLRPETKSQPLTSYKEERAKKFRCLKIIDLIKVSLKGIVEREWERC